METTATCRLLFLCLCFHLVSQTRSEEKFRKVRGVSLGGWLIVEGWIKHSLFDDIPNGDMLDGTEVLFKSVTTDNYISAEKGGGLNVTINTIVPSSFETFRLWRVSEVKFQFRTSGGQFLSCGGDGCYVSARAKSPSENETFYIERNYNRIHIRPSNGSYLQAASSYQLTADYPGKPSWDDNNATFEMIIVSTDYHGEFQLTNGYGPDKAKEILKAHRDSFVTAEDFKFLSKQGINTVRVPVGWWIYKDPNPPAPYVGGSLAALDNAFEWAQAYDMKCIIDLHAAPGSQNGKETSSSRDGSSEWATSQEYISQTLDVIDFLASRYTKHPALLGISLLNNPNETLVPLDVLVSYYSKGYETVRKYSPTTYVIVTQRIGKADPIELFHANIGSSNLVVEIHFYNNEFMTANSSVKDNIELVQNRRRAQIKALNAENGPLVFVGEWVNLMNPVDGSKSDYQEFGKVQVEVYNEASFGWAYWTLKNYVKHWDFEWNIQTGYLQLSNSPRELSSSYHIMLIVAAWAYYTFLCLS